ncbi:MAG TPA: hypothetical protein VGD80_41290 [Kofleriaceae bacterium]
MALALVLIEGVAWADDPLVRARQAVGESDYVAARSALVAAREAGGCSPAQTVELYQLSGIVEAALGDTDAATDAFAHLLALSPTAALPPGTAPKITRLLETARLSFLDGAPLEVKIETAARPPAITLIVVRDPLRMVAAARVTYTVDGGPERTAVSPASPRTGMPLPPGRLAARVSALDEHGNRLVDIGSSDAPITIVAEPPTPAAPAAAPPPVRALAARRPLLLRWWPYAAATVVSGAATAYFDWTAYDLALDLQRARSKAEADAIVERGRRATLFTNLGFGVTGAFALTAAVMFAIKPRSQTETHVTAVPAPGGGAIVLGGRF